MENYSIKTVCLSLTLMITSYLLGTLILIIFNPLLGLFYLFLCIITLLCSMKLRCTHCFYYGKRCYSGLGVISKIFFSKGDSEEFTNPKKVINTLKECRDLHEIHQDKKFRAALDILKSNIKIKSQASERVIKIAQSLKDFARLDMKEFQEADINERIENTLTLLDHKFKNRISVVRDFEEIPRILCYSNQLTQVFMNIFTNASEAIKDKGTITVKTAREKDSIIVRISDNGVGIEEGNLEKIFNPGFTTKGVGVGTGLGLSISYRIIKAHKGEIEVRSEVGKGTDFILTLPINKQEKKQATNYHDDN